MLFFESWYESWGSAHGNSEMLRPLAVIDLEKEYSRKEHI